MAGRISWPGRSFQEAQPPKPWHHLQERRIDGIFLFFFICRTCQWFFRKTVKSHPIFFWCPFFCCFRGPYWVVWLEGCFEGFSLAICFWTPGLNAPGVWDVETRWFHLTACILRISLVPEMRFLKPVFYASFGAKCFECKFSTLTWGIMIWTIDIVT